MKELMSQNLRDLWKEWELRLIVMCSLLLQILLTLAGNRRRSIHSNWQRCMLWCMYVLANWVADLGIGVLLDQLSEVRKARNGPVDPKTQLIALWAPFLLVHLGGPDILTAYSSEDNELWCRHLVRLMGQTGMVLYIYFMALTGSPLSTIACVIIGIGTIKYVERTVAFFSASKGPLRESIVTSPHGEYSMIKEKCRLKQQEGYLTSVEKLKEVQPPKEFFPEDTNEASKGSTKCLSVATKMFEAIKCLFVDLILNPSDLWSSEDLFNSPRIETTDAFEVVAIELSFMFDILYTKAKLLCNYWGFISRSLSFIMLMGVLVFFSLEKKEMYKPVDVGMTFVLLLASIVLEVYTGLVMVSLDWFRRWWWQNQKGFSGNITAVMGYLQVLQLQRWSETIGQFSLIDLSVNGPFASLHRQKWTKHNELVESIERYTSTCHKDFKISFKKWIFNQVKIHAAYEVQRSMLSTYQAREILTRRSLHDIFWSVENIDFGQSILIWHIATEICYYNDRTSMRGQVEDVMINFKMSKIVSRYMLYLLAWNPSMLPIGKGQRKYTDMVIEIRKTLQDRSELNSRILGPACLKQKELRCACTHDGQQCTCSEEDGNARRCINCIEEGIYGKYVCKPEPHKRKSMRFLCQSSNLLKEGSIEHRMSRRDRKLDLIDACDLAKFLNDIDDPRKKWDTIADVWAEALLYAAGNSAWDEHAKRLSYGGELLSHVWLLMAHFGISKQIRGPDVHAIGKIVTK